MLLHYKIVISNKETPSKLLVRSFLWEETSTEMAQCFLEKQSQQYENNSQCLSEWLESRLRESPTSAADLQNNCPFLLGVNTKQLSNQMLELTKVINELKDVLIQQVTTTNSSPVATWSLLSHPWPPRQLAWLHINLFMFDLFQVKETSFLRNTISECQACGKIMSNDSHVTNR